MRGSKALFCLPKKIQAEGIRSPGPHGQHIQGHGAAQADHFLVAPAVLFRRIQQPPGRTASPADGGCSERSAKRESGVSTLPAQLATRDDRTNPPHPARAAWRRVFDPAAALALQRASAPDALRSAQGQHIQGPGDRIPSREGTAAASSNQNLLGSIGGMRTLSYALILSQRSVCGDVQRWCLRPDANLIAARPMKRGCRFCSLLRKLHERTVCFFRIRPLVGGVPRGCKSSLCMS